MSPSNQFHAAARQSRHHDNSPRHIIMPTPRPLKRPLLPFPIAILLFQLRIPAFPCRRFDHKTPLPIRAPSRFVSTHQAAQTRTQAERNQSTQHTHVHTYLRKSLSTGKHCTALSRESGLCTSHLYCSIWSNSQAERSILEFAPGAGLRRRPWTSSWMRAGSSDAGNEWHGGVITETPKH